MQVFFDEQIFVEQRYGGISRYICELAQTLAATNRIQVTVYGGWTGNEYIAELRNGQNLKVVYKPRRDELRINSLAKKLSRTFRRKAFANALKKDSQIIYHPTFFDPDPELSKLAQATVSTFYDFIPELEKNPNPRSQQFLDKRREMAKTADAILAISNSTKVDFAKFLPESASKVEVSYLASRFAWDKTITRKPSALIVGTRSAYKNGEAALRAFANAAIQRPDIHLMIAGGGTLNENEKIILSECMERVSFVAADDTSLQKAYSAATVLLYPSRYEGFGLPVLEAMQCGCVVITTKESSLPEVGGAAAIYLQPDDIEGMTDKICMLLKDEKAVDTHRKAGLLRAEEFSWNKTAKETLEVYERLINTR